MKLAAIYLGRDRIAITKIKNDFYHPFGQNMFCIKGIKSLSLPDGVNYCPNFWCLWYVKVVVQGFGQLVIIVLIGIVPDQFMKLQSWRSIKRFS